MTANLVLLFILVGIVALGAAITYQLRTSFFSGAKRKDTYAGIAFGIVQPLVIYLLSFVFAWGLQRLEVRCGWVREWERYLQVWLHLCGVAVALAAFEGVLLAIAQWRKRVFPVPPLLRNIVRVGVLLVVAMILLRRSLGINVTPLLASTALVTAVVGFALQGVLGNLLAGMSLHLVRAVMPGDWLRIDDVEGQVVEMNWRETRLRGVNGHYWILPNSRVAAARIHNMTSPDARRRHELTFPISPAEPPDRVMRELRLAAREVPDVLSTPSPDVVIVAIKEYAIEYQLRFWSEKYHQRCALESEVYRRAWYRLVRAGIRIPFPLSEPWIAGIRRAIAEPEAWLNEDRVARIMALKRSELVRMWFTDPAGEPLLSSSDIERLAENARIVRYAGGETIIRQGEEGASCFIVKAGRVRGEIHYEDVAEPVTFELREGAVFGEMSLITGLPRTATITALEETELVEISEDALKVLLSLRPELAERLADLASQRAASNAEEWKRLRDLSKAKVLESARRATIFERLRRLLTHT